MLSNRVYLAFGLVLVLSIVVAIYPFLPNVNPNQVNPGVDISDYESDYYVIAADPSQMFTTMGGSRPIYYLTLFAFQRVLSLDPLNTIRLFPILLNPLLCASVFILTRETARESYLAAYASFFTVSGFTLSVGMYAYWLADMLMLSIVFLSLAALLKALREKSRIYLATAILLGCLFVFTHPWTFDQYMAAFGGAAVIAFIDLRRGERSYETVWLIFYCAVVASTDVLKLILLRGSVEGVAAIVFLSSSLTTPTTFWLNLVNSSRFYVGGYLTNMPLLALAALGIVKARQRILANLFFWVLIGATSVVYLVGDVVIKSRVLYNIPVGVLAAYGVAYIDELNVGARLKLILKAAIIVSLLSYLFRDLANLI